MNFWTEKYNLLIFETLDSSNDEAKRLYHAGVRKNLVLWTKSQGAGRGRNNRFWESPEGNLYLSILLNESYDINLAKYFSYLTIVALGEAISELTEDAAKISYKWPNDLLLNEKKLSGILIESVEIVENKVPALVIGVGCNIGKPPSQSSYGATCLDEAGFHLEIKEILDKFIQKFIYNKDLMDKFGIKLILDKWKEKKYGSNRRLIKLNNEEILGSFKDIDDEGRAIIELDNGKLRKIDSGEIFFLKELEEGN